MPWNVWILFSWVVPILGSRGPISMPFSREMTSSENENVVLLKWGYDRELQEISIEIQTPLATWVVLGLSPEGKLNASDFAVGGWDKENKQVFYDAHFKDEWPPVMDKSQDYELLELSRNETHVVLRVWRQWFTCDSHDLEIENDTIRVIVVFGEDHEFTLLEKNTYIKSFFFLEILKELTDTENLIPYEFRVNDFLIPADDTTYACTFIPMPNVSTKHHIVRYELIVDPDSVGIVHHILIYGCGNNLEFSSEIGACYGSDTRYSKCMNSLFGWAVGGEVFDFSPDMGVPIGTEEDPKYIRLEIHYSNFHNKEGLLDSSGIRIYYTPQLREHDGGILMTGIFTFPIHFIPPGADHFRNYGLCNTELIPQMLGHPVEDFHVNTFLLHGHLTVQSIRIMHYRNGTLIGSLGEDKRYDFNFQQVRDLPGVITVQMGDQIVVECSSSTPDREGVTFGGPSTTNEMCVVFLFYYPVVPIAACWSLLDIQHVVEVLELDESETIMDAIININGVDWDEETIVKAQNAILEADHTAIITHRTGEMINETSSTLPIFAPTPHPCHEYTDD
ncbi:putative DBH-like monooxygenase protein 2 [Rana temporaria]|uniref:putative DBH-like monooxygenase protein 2 n=1 Tax=Rana temporaria TaxID=8407 RepID=UPI001AADE6DB|nr:putative DBH-like monooxygenase protein 2 [Rana temporaria]